MSRPLNYRFPWKSSLSVLAVSLAVAAVACGGASDANFEPAPGGSSAGSSSNAAAGSPMMASGGSVAAGGQLVGSGGSGSPPGSGGNFQFAGASNQPGGSGGALVTGGGGAGSGTAGSGGAKSGSGGATGGSGGAKSGSGGSGGSSSGGSAGSGGSAPTWTEIYTKFLTNTQYASNCNGSACHNPGKQKGYDFSTQANGYASVKSKTTTFVNELSSGAMPQGKPKMPAADLAVIKAWVAAGAQNN
ncbi:MAG TPA: hypothetical protein VFK05_30005 [Polyangiaceae bacterium]|nr:hypothetical protein [Polyangiaceae bacterium]